jgi:hypothetical protein
MGEQASIDVPADLVERVLAAVLRRPATEPEIGQWARLVDAAWRAAGRPSADTFLADVGDLVSAARACRHVRMRGIRGEFINVLPEHQRSAEERPATMLDPRQWAARLKVARAHRDGDGGACGCS